MDSRLYWIWLQAAVPLGHRAAGRILEDGRRPEAIHAAGEKELAAMGLAGLPGLLDKQLDGAADTLRRACAGKDWVLTPDDAAYPQRLREIAGPPLALFCRGDAPDWQERPAFGLVGTRRATDGGKRNAACLAAGLAAGGMIVVSGGAVGIDGAAHFGAVRAGGVTVVVMACPVTGTYPEENEELRREIVASGGLLLSEFPPGRAAKCDFHVRNRLISGLSVGVCLGETPERSGSLITGTLARDQGRDVYAMPGDLQTGRNGGAHQQIRSGAVLVTRAEEILEDYQERFPGLLDLQAAAKAQEAMSAFCRRQMNGRARQAPEAGKRRAARERRDDEPRPLPAGASAQAAALHALLKAEPAQADTLAEEAGLPLSQALAALTELELLGAARGYPGRRYGL